MSPATEPSKPGNEKIKIGSVQKFAPMGAPQETFVHGKDVLTEREK